MKNGGKVPHTALIYADRHDRNRIIKSYMKRTECRWDSLTVLTTHPEADADFFGRLNRKDGAPRTRCTLSIIDAREALAEPKPARAIMELVEGTRTEKRPLLIGDWLHDVYDRFEVGLEVEEFETRANMDNLVCCYRREGLSTLTAKQIGRALELHYRILLGNTSFDKEVGLDLVHIRS